MPMTMTERLDHARAALTAYLDAKGEALPEGPWDYQDTDASDLIADLLHLQKWLGLRGTEETLATAMLHFEAEQADVDEDSQDCAGFQKLIYMPRESTPTIATSGNREAVAYMELGERTDDYGRLFAKAPRMWDTLLTIKRLAESGDDAGHEAYPLLALIAQQTRAALASGEE
jgi:hypothetical protein